ncbi:hypothetical protein GCM10027447_03850 [Glycomyces halotolerans]
MDRSADQTLTDLDGHVTIRVAADGEVAVEVSATGFRQPPAALAHLIVETGARLPNPADEGRDALESGAKAVADVQQALATGGFEAFSAMMRSRLGIEEPATPPIRSSEQDASLAAALGATLDNMRKSAAPKPEPEPVVEATAATDEGDLAVTTTSERVIASVHIGPTARNRGVEGLGETLTSLLAQARADLHEQSREHLERELPDETVETMEQAPAEGERAGRLGSRMMDDVVRETESLRRKAGK